MDNEHSELRAERDRLRAQLAEAEEILENQRLMLAVAPCGVCHVSSEGRVVRANDHALVILGMSREDLEAAHTPDFDDRTVWEDGTPCPLSEYPVTKAIVEGTPQGPVVIGTHRVDTGELRWSIYQAFPTRDREGAVTGAVVSFLDISDRKAREAERSRLEERLVRSQQLESLGVLAGGIAHDFNNLLVGVLGYAGLARLEVGPDAKVLGTRERIEEAARRASELTKQMLAFAGQGEFAAEPVDISELVQQSLRLLSVSISRSVRIETDLSDAIPLIDADPSQLRQVLMNLVFNAAEATEGDGEVRLRTGAVTIDSTHALASARDGDTLAAGAYVTLEVSDDGRGMTEETKRRVFEPFFTTKATGRGLGLSSVHGIVKRHGGALHIDSTPGVGTTFAAYFPARERGAVASSGTSRGRVLVVDDDPSVRTFLRRGLRNLGFETLLASDGQEGIETFAKSPQSIDVVLLDFVMPKKNGAEVFREILAIDPTARVILSSGYTRDQAITGLVADGLVGFLEKPFGVDQLAAMLDEALLGPH